MAFVTTESALMAMATGDLRRIGSEMAAGNAAVASPTTGVIPAAADEASVLTAAQFATHAEMYQSVSVQAAAIHQMSVAVADRWCRPFRGPDIIFARCDEPSFNLGRPARSGVCRKSGLRYSVCYWVEVSHRHLPPLDFITPLPGCITPHQRTWARPRCRTASRLAAMSSPEVRNCLAAIASSQSPSLVCDSSIR
jgi:PE family